MIGADAVRRLPEGVDVRHAAAFGVAHRGIPRAPLGGGTAAWRPAGRAGRRGGVGLAAVQLGALLGATVLRWPRRPKLEVAKARAPPT